MLARQPAAGRDTAIGVRRHRDGNVRVDEDLAARGDGCRLRGVEVVAGGVGGATGGCFGGRGEKLDLEGWRGGFGEGH